jgi:hypothetical protein
VVAKVARVRGAAVRSEVCRRRDRQDPRFQELARGEAPHRRIPEPQRHIKPVGNEVADLIAHDQFEPQLAMEREEAQQLTR